jgi:hypothetical protein
LWRRGIFSYQRTLILLLAVTRLTTVCLASIELTAIHLAVIWATLIRLRVICLTTIGLSIIGLPSIRLAAKLAASTILVAIGVAAIKIVASGIVTSGIVSAVVSVGWRRVLSRPWVLCALLRRRVLVLPRLVRALHLRGQSVFAARISVVVVSVCSGRFSMNVIGGRRRIIFVYVIDRSATGYWRTSIFSRSIPACWIASRRILLRTIIVRASAVELLLTAGLNVLRSATVSVGNWRAAFNARTRALHRRMRCRRSGAYGARVRMNFRMRNDLRAGNLVYINPHGFTRHRA